MTALELNIKKQELIRSINEVNSEDILNALDGLLRKMTRKEAEAPCQYSVKELNNRAQQAVRDYKEGKRMVPHSSIKKKTLA